MPGAVHIYEVGAGGLKLAHTLRSSHYSSLGMFGYSLATSNGRLLIGAPGEGPPASNGRVYSFKNDGTNWLESGELQPGDSYSSVGFGRFVAASASGVAIAEDHKEPIRSSTFDNASVYVVEFP